MSLRALLLFFILSASLSAAAFAATPGEVEIGGYLRAAKLHGFAGQTNSFADFKGKPLIINIWASWCYPCRAEMASLQRLASRTVANSSM